MLISTPIPLEKIEMYVESLYNRFKNPELLYHNLQHTQKVVQHGREIAAAYSIKSIDQFVLIVAAWFHDTGHLFGTLFHHEERSVEIMKDYLEKEMMDIKAIYSIEGCIMATRVGSLPATFLEEIICDADTYNLGTNEFIFTDSQLKKEFELRGAMPAEGWDESTLAMLKKHTYYTSYCQALLNKVKQENIDIVSKRMQRVNYF